MSAEVARGARQVLPHRRRSPLAVDRSTLFIDGDWVAPSSSSRITVLNAATEDVLGTAPEADMVDVDRAVAYRCRQLRVVGSDPGGSGCRDEPLRGRIGKALRRVTRTVSQESGMPIGLSDAFEGGFAIGLLRYYADLAATMSVEDVRPSQSGIETVLRRSSAGVVAAIVPWNYPAVLAMSKIAPARAAGCAVVVNRHRRRRSWTIGSPFGGVKDSGLGREFGPEALDSYLDLKSMYIAKPAQPSSERLSNVRSNVSRNDKNVSETVNTCHGPSTILSATPC